ncbi:hypothetical protein [Paraburkholderia strydomiana]|uniref:Uncharacterized protein n=1 Tax=Paraburkholderia strydomiana TaxID=1245417 RepID=A0ABW9BTZ8_9BURK
MNTGAASLSDEQRTTIQHAADKLRTVWANHTGDKESRELCHKLEAILATPTPLADAAIAAGGAQETAAARDVLAERQRQVSAEGWTPEHDDDHTEAEMALAAACYAMAAGGYAKGQTPPIWPWSLSWWKPAYGRRDLIKAGALILAEIERVDRASATGAAKGEAT